MLQMWDVEIEDRKRWCQYIAFRNMWRVAYARVTYSTITDTELQVARWVLPEPGRPVDYRTNEELYHHWWEDKVSEDWRFTQKFRGNGTRWVTPRAATEAGCVSDLVTYCELAAGIRMKSSTAQSTTCRPSGSSVSRTRQAVSR